MNNAPLTEPRMALVTGASHGIGRAVSLALSRLGYFVVATARNLDELRETADRVGSSSESHKCEVVAADIAQSSGRRKIIETLQAHGTALSLFVHAASASTDPEAHSRLEDTPQEVVSELAAVNVEGSFLLTKDLLPLLTAAGKSNIIFISSDWALRGSHGPPVFAAAKAALAHLGHTMRRDLASSGISLTVLYPGDVATFDADWKEPKWDLDDPIESVVAELGQSRIPLVDITETIQFIISRKLARVEEIVMAPLSADYDY